jgi:hypothetical protein
MVAVERPQEGRDEGRVRAQGFEAEGVGVGGELPPAGVVGPAGVLGGGAGDEARSVVMARATVGEAEGGTSITLEGLRSGEVLSKTSVIIPDSTGAKPRRI